MQVVWFAAPQCHNYTCRVLQKFQDIEENHILHIKEIIRSYSQSVEETHIQIGEVSVSTYAYQVSDIPVGGVGVLLTWGCARWVHWVSFRLVSSLISLIISLRTRKWLCYPFMLGNNWSEPIDTFVQKCAALACLVLEWIKKMVLGWVTCHGEWHQAQFAAQLLLIIISVINRAASVFSYSSAWWNKTSLEPLTWGYTVLKLLLLLLQSIGGSAAPAPAYSPCSKLERMWSDKLPQLLSLTVPASELEMGSATTCAEPNQNTVKTKQSVYPNKLWLAN